MTRRRLPWLACGLAVASVWTANVWRSAATPPPVRPAFESAGPADEARCAGCHASQVDLLRDAPHTVTLRPASDRSVSEAFADAGNPHAAAVGRYGTEGGRLALRSAALPGPVPVDWVFGSGRHALTPVSVWRGPDGRTALLEHWLSRYPSGEVGLTLGLADPRATAIGLDACGKRLTPEEAAGCFGCHSTWLPRRGQALDLSGIVPGVRCARCHAGGDGHARAAERGDDDLLMERWGDLDPLESIRRCGECHRRDDQMPPDELRTDNRLLVRFAPAALSQSPCFRSQGAARLDCLTCHDPHRPAETAPAYYAAVCRSCHSGRPDRHAACRVEPVSDACIGCHMPKVEVQPHLRFTDHWIRIRHELPTPPAGAPAP